MPRRSRPWVTVRRPPALVFVWIITSRASSVGFIPLQCPRLPAASVGRWLQATPCHEGVSTGSLGSAAEVWLRRRRRSLLMESEREGVAIHLEGGPVAPARPTPFVGRKLGSFEKMLTQTRDGHGPAEKGIRTLLTPHVWVSGALVETKGEYDPASRSTHDVSTLTRHQDHLFCHRYAIIA